MEQNKYVWYASYGSNLSRERFLCYIQGGRPAESTKVEKGCRDKSLPIEDRKIAIPYELYFAKHSSRWGGAVCFLAQQKLGEEDENITLGRMYLITKEQFADVVSQENDGKHIEINFEEVIDAGAKVITQAWYGNIVYLGCQDNYPIFTFTASWKIEEAEFKKPSGEYLRTLSKGLQDRYGLRKKEIARYLSTKKGILGNIALEKLESML